LQCNTCALGDSLKVSRWPTANHRIFRLPQPHVLQAIIKNADMSEDMQQDAVDCASQAMEKFNLEKDIAACKSGRILSRLFWRSPATWHHGGRILHYLISSASVHLLMRWMGGRASCTFQAQKSARHVRHDCFASRRYQKGVRQEVRPNVSLHCRT
jgi:hypothetical protein